MTDARTMFAVRRLAVDATSWKSGLTVSRKCKPHASLSPEVMPKYCYEHDDAFHSCRRLAEERGSNGSASSVITMTAVSAASPAPPGASDEHSRRAGSQLSPR